MARDRIIDVIENLVWDAWTNGSKSKNPTSTAEMVESAQLHAEIRDRLKEVVLVLEGKATLPY